MKTIPQISVDSQILAKRLRALQLGETVSYADLSKLIQRNVQRAGRPTLYTALRLVLREDGMVIEAVRSVGVQRLLNQEVSKVGFQAIKSMRRKCSRTLKKCACADPRSLSPADQTRLNAVTSIVGAMSLFTKPANVERIELAAAQKQDKISHAETLALFGGK